MLVADRRVPFRISYKKFSIVCINFNPLSKNNLKNFFINVYIFQYLFRLISEVMIMREEEKKRTSPNSIFRKRWVFPAIYLVSAAIILTGVLWFQNSNNDVAETDDYSYDGTNEPGTAFDDESLPVNTANEEFAMPVLDENTVEIQRQFYDVDASEQEQEAALVFYDNTYYENKGIDIVAKDGKAFDVVASLGGTVVKSEKDPLFGHVVEIEHAEGVVTVYQSLADVKVKQGDVVDQGEVMAKAGQNTFDAESATHVHFEIRNNGKAVNPIDFFGKSMTSLEEDQKTSEEPAEEKKAPASEDGDEEKAPATGDESADEEEKAPATDEESSDEEEGTPAEDEKPEGEEGADSLDSTDASIGMATV